MKLLLRCAFGILAYYGWFLGIVAIHDTNHLPHRPIGEIDLQGHLYLAPSHVCSSVYDAPYGNLRFCWSGL